MSYVRTVLQMRKLRHQEAGKWWNWDLGPQSQPYPRHVYLACCLVRRGECLPLGHGLAPHCHVCGFQRTCGCLLLIHLFLGLEKFLFIPSLLSLSLPR